MIGLKEEIKAIYGDGKVYSVSTVSRVNPLSNSKERQEQGNTKEQDKTVQFSNILEKSLEFRDGEMKCSTASYNRDGIYQEYLYLTREYRR